MPRKGENIYKRKDGRWEGRYIKSRSPEGKAIYGYVYAKSYREVKKKQQDAMYHSNVLQVPHQDPDSIVFQDIAEEWLRTVAPLIKESTFNKYRNLLDSYIIPSFKNVQLECITHDFIEAKCNALLLTGGKRQEGLSPKTVSDALGIIRSVLRYASQNGKTVICDGRSVQIRHIGKEMRVLSRNEQEKLCRYLYSDLNIYHIGILVCLFTGLRVGEICALRWEDISLTERTIHVCRTLQRIQNRSGSGRKTKIIITAPKSSCSIRTIPIPDHFVNAISNFHRQSSGYFLTDKRGNPVEPRTMQNQFKRALHASGVAPANFHALRHTFATRCVELGFDIKSLSELLGHSNVNITMNRYVHPSMELKRENMERFSELFSVK